MAARWGIEVDFMPGDWRHGVDPAAIEAKLAQDSSHAIKAVMVVHNETSTGVTSRVAEIRAAIDKVGHPALLLVDTISSLGSVDYRHDEWKVDVTVSCSQKGFMLPPGLGFNAISEKARAAAKTNKMPRSYWDWEEMLKPNANGFFPYTPATNLLYGLREAIAMLLEEGLDDGVRPSPAPRGGHPRRRHALGSRSAVSGAVRIFAGADGRADAARARRRQIPQDRARELQHVARFRACRSSPARCFGSAISASATSSMLLGALTGVEMGLSAAGVPHRAGGVAAAMSVLEERTQSDMPAHLKVISN